MAVQRRDGSIWMLIRTPHGMGQSVSHDMGQTWASFEHATIPHCSSRFFLTRLASGRLLLIKHGPMRKTVGRENMTALLSDDDGLTWPHALLLKPGMCSYPDGDQDADGRIHLVYDHGRKGTGAEILHSVFREADILAGRLVSDDARLNQLVARTGPMHSYGVW